MAKRHTRTFALLLISILIASACSGEKNTEEYLQDGRKYIENEDWSKAIAALEEVLKREIGHPEALRLLGEALGESGRWPEAVEQLEVYKATESQDPRAYSLLGRAYVQTGQMKEAATTFAEGVQLDPSFLESHREEIAGAVEGILQTGREALATGDLATANELLSSIAPLVGPDQAEVYFELGQANLQANDLVRALQTYAYARDLNPELATDHADKVEDLVKQAMDIGQGALDAGDLERAAQITDAVAAFRPDDPQVHFLLGNIYNEADQLLQAIEQYQTVLELEPDNASARTNLGVVYYKMGQLQAAIQEYEAALQIGPDDAETHYLLGAAYIQIATQLQETESEAVLAQGKAEFEAAIALDKELAPAYIGLGNIYLLQGDLESASDILEKAVAMSPDSPEAYFALGQIFIQLGDTESARTALNSVLSLNPDPYWRKQAEQLLQGLESP